MAAIPASAQQQDHGALRLLIGASAVFVVLTAGLYAWTISWMWPFPRDGSTLVVGRDFLNFWMYGQTAWTPDPSRIAADAAAKIVAQTPSLSPSTSTQQPRAIASRAPSSLRWRHACVEAPSP
jgi:hypothetical protein